jgi:ribosome maturation factor RimP
MTYFHPTPGIDRETLERVLEPVLVAHGVAGVEVTFQRERSGWVLRVSIEVPGSTEPGAGITLDRCAEVSRDLSHALDVEDFITNAYNLEIASPGLDRGLFAIAEYARFVGKQAKVTLRKPAADGQAVLRGTIERVDGDVVTMLVDGKEMSFPIADARAGNLVFELGAKPAPRGRPSQKKSAGRPSKRATGTE